MEEFQVVATNESALFTLKVHRGDGMALLAMNWATGTPPQDFVGFAIEYKEPNGEKFFVLKNRLCFTGATGDCTSTRLSPIQKFRWVHFPRNAELKGLFTYRVTPVFMNDSDELSYGESQRVEIELRRETYTGKLNVCYTRGFVSSQGFIDRYGKEGINTLLPKKAEDGLSFNPTHPKAQEALAWMGFEARDAILDLLDEAVADTTAQVKVIAYDLNEPEVVSRLVKLGSRLMVIIDKEGAHGKAGSAENEAEKLLKASAGVTNVKRQSMGKLQHNKTIIVKGRKPAVACGSTNFSWRGFYIQSNNAVLLRGGGCVAAYLAAFENYWNSDEPSDFVGTASAGWTDLGLDGIAAQVAFSPHSPSNALLQKIADDIEQNTESSLFYSLAFLSQTPGPILKAIEIVTNRPDTFVYGVADKKTKIELQKPDGNLAPVYAEELGKDVPEPFKPEPGGGSGIRMHHKFVVIDFNKPSARVYLGSYNFSDAADTKNGENLLLIRDRRVAVSYMVEALRIFDHYHFRVAQKEAAIRRLELAKPPRDAGEKAWWEEHYSDPVKIRDRELFA